MSGERIRASHVWLLAASLCVAAGLAELIVRGLHPAVLELESRVFFTDTPFLHDERGTHYPPNRAVRAAPVTREGLEWDARFTTNNLGFVDHRDYSEDGPAGPSLVFVGDSYAAGVEGGKPWIPDLRDTLGLRIYNLGMGATGVQHFERLIQGLPRWIAPTEIVVIAISDDFFRPLWRPLVSSGQIRLCAEQESDAVCGQRPVTAHLIEQDGQDLVSRARQIRAEAAPATRGTRSWLSSSRLLVFVKRSVEQLWRRRLRAAVFEENLRALRRIGAKHLGARVRLVHVPDKYELRLGRYEIDLAAEAKAARIEYIAVLGNCPLTPGDFFAHDDHPNAVGYRKLSDCVSRLLALGR